jgi:glycosyltransferase involved in cell wall biosynthesis
MLKIILYFPYRGIGGVSVLFLRLAQHLSHTQTVFVADYSDGYMAKNLPAGVGLIRIDTDDVFPSESVFVFQSFLPWRFPFLSRIDLNSRILFWNLHPQNFDPSIFNNNSENKLFSAIAKAINLLAVVRMKKIRSFVSYLLNNDALLIMDRENARTVGEILGRNLNSLDFLPVPSTRMSLAKNPAPVGGVVRCAWVGRIADFKYRILEHLIIRLHSAANVLGPIRLIVVGDGEYASYIREVASSHQSENFKVEFVGELPTMVLPKYLVENVDILFSMGTSALEGAALKIPVLLTDYSFKKIEHIYRFSPLFENSGYCLGEEIAPQHYEEKSTLEHTIQQIMSNYDDFASKSFDYWDRNFSMEVVAPKFLTRCSGTRATFGDIYKRGFLTPDGFGLFLRSCAWALRGRRSKKTVGFRHDC